jgi:enoyl-CoA hydratase/carnithine racemase
MVVGDDDMAGCFDLFVRRWKLNGAGIEVMDFEKLFPMFDVDERVKVVVLTGAGKTFCAGADRRG